MTTSFFSYFPHELLVGITHMLVWDDPFCLGSIALISKSWREAVKIVCKELCEKFSFAPQEVLKNDTEVNWISLFGRLYPSTHNLCCGRILKRTLFAAPLYQDYTLHTAVAIYDPSSLNSSSPVDYQKQSEPSGLGGLLKSLLPWKKPSSSNNNDTNNNNPLDTNDDVNTTYFLEIWEPRLQFDCIVHWTLHLRSSWGPGSSSLGWNEYDLMNEKYLVKPKNTKSRIDYNFPQYSKIITLTGLCSKKRGDTVIEKLTQNVVSSVVVKNSNPYSKPNFVILNSTSQEVYDIESMKTVCTFQKKNNIIAFYYPYILCRNNETVTAYDLVKDQTIEFATNLKVFQIHRNKAVVCNDQDQISIVDFPQGTPILYLHSEGEVKSVAISSSLVAVATKDLLTVYSVFTGALLQNLFLQHSLQQMYLFPGKLIGFENKSAKVWYFDRRDLAKTVNGILVAPGRNPETCPISIHNLMKCISARLGIKEEANMVVSKTIKEVEGERILAFQAKVQHKQAQHRLLDQQNELLDWAYEDTVPYLRYVGSSAIVLREVWNEKYQEWNFVDCESSYFSMIGITYRFFMVHKGSGLVLDVDRRNKIPLTPVIIWNRKTKYTENQLWSLELWKEDWFVIRSYLNSLVIGIASHSFDISPSTSPATIQQQFTTSVAYTLQTEECHYSDSQLWRYDEQKESLQNKGSMYFLNVVKGVPVVSPRRADCWEFGREFM